MDLTILDVRWPLFFLMDHVRYRFSTFSENNEENLSTSSLNFFPNCKLFEVTTRFRNLTGWFAKNVYIVKSKMSAVFSQWPMQSNLMYFLFSSSFMCAVSNASWRIKFCENVSYTWNYLPSRPTMTKMVCLRWLTFDFWTINPGRRCWITYANFS